jgi:3-methyl-2-oxobutanoate hydroxymethyltransferase
MPSIRDFAAAKLTGRKLVLVTAYDAALAGLLNESPVDALVVGDSAMMVVHGHSDTLQATPELMALHTRAVALGAPNKLIIGDMPFLTARKGPVHALDCAAQLIRAGAHAVKIEGIRGHGDVVRHLVESGIPVMGHLGLKPQSVRGMGGYAVQAKDPASVERLKREAAELEEAGAFSLVLECIPSKVARELTRSLRIPTIGIGAGAHCDGQILVLHDLLGLNPNFRPRFVRRFGDGATLVKEAVKRYSAAVGSGRFPSGRESF